MTYPTTISLLNDLIRESRVFETKMLSATKYYQTISMFLYLPAVIINAFVGVWMMVIAQRCSSTQMSFQGGPSLSENTTMNIASAITSSLAQYLNHTANVNDGNATISMVNGFMSTDLFSRALANGIFSNSTDGNILAGNDAGDTWGASLQQLPIPCPVKQNIILDFYGQEQIQTVVTMTWADYFVASLAFLNTLLVGLEKSIRPSENAKTYQVTARKWGAYLRKLAVYKQLIFQHKKSMKPKASVPVTDAPSKGQGLPHPPRESIDTVNMSPTDLWKPHLPGTDSSGNQEDSSGNKDHQSISTRRIMKYLSIKADIRMFISQYVMLIENSPLLPQWLLNTDPKQKPDGYHS